MLLWDVVWGVLSSDFMNLLIHNNQRLRPTLEGTEDKNMEQRKLQLLNNFSVFFVGTSTSPAVRIILQTHSPAGESSLPPQDQGHSMDSKKPVRCASCRH